VGFGNTVTSNKSCTSFVTNTSLISSISHPARQIAHSSNFAWCSALHKFHSLAGKQRQIRRVSFQPWLLFTYPSASSAALTQRLCVFPLTGNKPGQPSHRYAAKDNRSIFLSISTGTKYPPSGSLRVDKFACTSRLRSPSGSLPLRAHARNSLYVPLPLNQKRRVTIRRQ